MTISPQHLKGRLRRAKSLLIYRRTHNGIIIWSSTNNPSTNNPKTLFHIRASHLLLTCCDRSVRFVRFVPFVAHVINSPPIPLIPLQALSAPMRPLYFIESLGSFESLIVKSFQSLNRWTRSNRSNHWTRSVVGCSPARGEGRKERREIEEGRRGYLYSQNHGASLSEGKLVLPGRF